jgi:hypothetical protein
MILLAAVMGLLLVGCLNVTNLLLSRAVGQKRQMAVAAALGASRAEMVRMAIRETAVLARRRSAGDHFGGHCGRRLQTRSAHLVVPRVGGRTSHAGRQSPSPAGRARSGQTT